MTKDSLYFSTPPWKCSYLFIKILKTCWYDLHRFSIYGGQRSVNIVKWTSRSQMNGFFIIILYLKKFWEEVTKTYFRGKRCFCYQTKDVKIRMCHSMHNNIPSLFLFLSPPSAAHVFSSNWQCHKIFIIKMLDFLQCVSGFPS